MVKYPKLRKIIIAAIAKNGIIGDKGKIPWNSEEELKHFKETTLGFPVIFGRKTFESLNNPLISRLNIVISKSNLSFLQKENPLYFNSLKNAYEYLRKKNYTKVFICGGRQIYKTAIRNSDEMIISKMNFDANGDTNFPKVNFKNWKLKKINKYSEFKVFYYIRQLK